MPDILQVMFESQACEQGQLHESVRSIALTVCSVALGCDVE